MTDNPESMNSDVVEIRQLSASRIIEASTERVYRAFVDPDELAQWMHPPGASAEVHHLDADEGGTYRVTMRGETPDGGEYSHTYGGTFRELVPGERIVQTEAPEVDDPADAEETTVTVTFDEVPEGTEVTVVMGVPADWPDDSIAGWEAALGNLAGRLEGSE